MWAQIGTFIIRAAPKAISTLLSPGKAKSLKFAATVGKLKKSKTYKAAAKFLNEDPTDWAKRNLKKSFENGDALKFLGGVASGLSDTFSSFIPKPRPMPSGANPRTSSGAAVPGAKGLSNSMANTTRAYNTSVRNLSKIAVAPPKGASKKVFDQYRASFSKRNVTLGELTSLNVQVTKKARDGVYSLGKGIEQSPKKGSLRNIPQAMKIRPAENMKESSSKELSNYIQSTINTSTETISKDIDIVNQNLEKVMSGLAKAQSDSNKALAMNLGNFTAQNISELARIITKSEETAFRKQQESSYYQTEVLSNKMDESHRYNAASLNAVREDILANTQSMYALEQESRRIDAEYREYEERKNAGVTLPALYGLTKQVGDMVQMTFRSHSEYDQAAQNAFRSLAGDFAYELGKMAGFLKEAMAAQRIFMCKIISGIEGFFSKILGDTWGPIFASPLTYMMKLTGKISTMLDGFIFNKLLGIKSSVLEDAYGAANSDCFNFMSKDKTTEEEKEHAYQSMLMNTNMTPQSGGKNATYAYADGSGFIHAAKRKDKGYGFSKNGESFNVELKRTNGVYNGNVNVQTTTGVLKSFKLDMKENESLEDFEQRALLHAVELEAADSISSFDNEGKYCRDTAEVAKRRYISNIKLITTAYADYVKKSRTSGIVCHYSCGGATDRYYGKIDPNHSTGVKSYSYNYGGWGRLCSYASNKNTANNSHTKIEISNELVNRVSLALKQAMVRGIPARVTSTVRVAPSDGSKITASNHYVGIAVDVNVGDFETTAGNIIKDYYKKDKGGLFWAAIISAGELKNAINTGTSMTGTPLSEKDLATAKNMQEWIEICTQFGLTVGVEHYKAAYEYRKESNLKNKPVIDIVHLQLAYNDKNDLAEKNFDANTKGDGNDFLDKNYIEEEMAVSEKTSLGRSVNTLVSSVSDLKKGELEGVRDYIKDSAVFGADIGEFAIGDKKVEVDFSNLEILDEKGEKTKTSIYKVDGEDYASVRTKSVEALYNFLKQSDISGKLGWLKEDDLQRVVDIAYGYYGKDIEDLFSKKFDMLQQTLENIQKSRSLTDQEKMVLNLTIQAQNTKQLPSVQNDLANIDDQSKKLN